MNVGPRSSSGLKCGGFGSGDSTLSPDRSEADERVGIEGASPSSGLG
jgi:hypothetical protein